MLNSFHLKNSRASFTVVIIQYPIYLNFFLLTIGPLFIQVNMNHIFSKFVPIWLLDLFGFILIITTTIVIWSITKLQTITNLCLFLNGKVDTYRVTFFQRVFILLDGFPSVSVVKKPPAVQETQEMWVQSLGWEDPLEEKMTTHSSILIWRNPWTEGTGELQSMRSQRVGHDYVTEHLIGRYIKMHAIYMLLS